MTTTETRPPLPPPATTHSAQRYLELAAELRAAADHCQAVAEADRFHVVGRAALERARVFRQAAAAADRAYWAVMVRDG